MPCSHHHAEQFMICRSVHGPCHGIHGNNGTSHQRPGPHHCERFRIQRAVPLFRSASPPSPRRRVRRSIPPHSPPESRSCHFNEDEPAAVAVHRSLPHRRGTAHTATCSASDLQRASERHPGLSSPSPSASPTRRPLASQVKSPPLPPRTPELFGERPSWEVGFDGMSFRNGASPGCHY